MDAHAAAAGDNADDPPAAIVDDIPVQSFPFHIFGSLHTQHLSFEHVVLGYLMHSLPLGHGGDHLLHVPVPPDEDPPPAAAVVVGLQHPYLEHVCFEGHAAELVHGVPPEGQFPPSVRTHPPVGDDHG